MAVAAELAGGRGACPDLGQHRASPGRRCWTGSISGGRRPRGAALAGLDPLDAHLLPLGPGARPRLCVSMLRSGGELFVVRRVPLVPPRPSVPLPHAILIMVCRRLRPTMWYAPPRNRLLGRLVGRLLMAADGRAAPIRDLAQKARRCLAARPIEVLPHGVDPWPGDHRTPRPDSGRKAARYGLGRPAVPRKNTAPCSSMAAGAISTFASPSSATGPSANGSKPRRQARLRTECASGLRREALKHRLLAKPTSSSSPRRMRLRLAYFERCIRAAIVAASAAARRISSSTARPASSSRPRGGAAGGSAPPARHDATLRERMAPRTAPRPSLSVQPRPSVRDPLRHPHRHPPAKQHRGDAPGTTAGRPNGDNHGTAEQACRECPIRRGDPKDRRAMARSWTGSHRSSSAVGRSRAPWRMRRTRAAGVGIVDEEIGKAGQDRSGSEDRRGPGVRCRFSGGCRSARRHGRWCRGALGGGWVVPGDPGCGGKEVAAGARGSCAFSLDSLAQLGLSGSRRR
jgi:hypothetical protein